MPLILPDQADRLRCIQDLESNLVVEAAAGTGKTSLMACRVAMLFAAGRDPSTIAAITFTETAASELGRRIHSIVEMLVADEMPVELRASLPNGLSADQRAVLESVTQRLDELTITTIHSFCQRIIIENAVEAGLDPGIKVADEIAAEAMFDRAFGDWLTRALSSGAPADRAVVVMAQDDPLKVEDRLRDLANVRRRHRRARPPEPDLEARPDIELVDAIDAFARWVADHPFERRTNAITEQFQRLRSHCYDGLAGTPDFDALWRLAHPPRIFLMKKRTLELAEYDQLDQWKRARGDEVGERLNAEAASLYAAVSGTFLALLAQVSSCMIWQLSASMQSALDNYDTLKRRAAVMDFDDLLEHARNLVVGNDVVRRNVSNRFRHILVDECQDTDTLQIEILFAIAGETHVEDWREARLRPGSLFLVGDPKQSIYRFRNADIDAYRAARDMILRQPDGALVQIKANFRSRGPIVDFVNASFISVFDGDGQPEYVALEGTVDDDTALMPAVVRLETGHGVDKPAEVRALEAIAVADLCEQLIGRLPVRDGDIVRPARAGDIALLAAGHTDLWRYERELEHRRISVASHAGKALMRRQETLDVLALLRTLADPTDTFALGAFLRGPMVGLTDQELLGLASELDGSGESQGHGLSLLSDASRIADDYARGIIETLQRLRRRAASVTPSQLLADALQELDARLVLSARHRNKSARALANVDALVEMGRRYAVSGLSTFVEDLQLRWEKAETVQEGRSDIVEDAVQIVTMHNAKGLEWPIVIPISMATNFPPRSQFVHQPGTRTLHWVIGDVAPGSLAEARAVEERQQANERQRMWYVACTRAKDLLVVPHLPTAKESSWFRAVQLDRVDCTALDIAALPSRSEDSEPVAVNEQTKEIFAREEELVLASAPPLRWRRPSLDETEQPDPIGHASSGEITAVVDRPAGAGPLRGSVLHRLLEEVIVGELSTGEDALRQRADTLVAQLVFLAPEDEVELPETAELARTVAVALAIPDVARMLPHLVPEVTVWNDEGGGDLLAGRADALVVVGSQVVGVVDWKSDFAPGLEDKHRYGTQISDYVHATGALAGALVFVTTREVVWIGNREALLDQLSGA
jgi:ATP-dependent exoDNAse (exonuclease V) beta subunit